MQIFSHVTTCDELAGAIDGLGKELSLMREEGRVNLPDVQRIASSLTQAQLALNALERVEAHERGASRESAERLAACEKGIRLLRFEIYRELRGEGPDGAAKGDDVQDPAG